MAKKGKKRKRSKEAPRSWRDRLKGPWALAAGTAAALAAVLLNINPILANLRNLPGEWGKTAGQFSSWYYEDEAWSGRWTSHPEGYVDAADMNLSDQKMVIDIEVKNGVIDGTIATEEICSSVPVFDFLLIRGHVDTFGSSADVVVWDIFGGHRADLGTLELKVDGITMTSSQTGGDVRLAPKLARLARDPNKSSEGLDEPCPNRALRSLGVLPGAIKKAAEESS